MLTLNLLKQRRHYFGLVSLTIQTPVVLRLHFPVLLMLWSALATNLHLVNVALVFLGSSFPAQDCRSGVPWFLWNWWNVDRALITRAPSVMFQFENRPTCSPCFGITRMSDRKRKKKKCGIGGFCVNFPMTERETMVVTPQTLVVYAPFAQRLNVVVLRFTARCNVGGCFWWMTAGQMHITCRLLPPQYRWPSSWSSRCCLCLVASMTSGLVDVGLPWTLLRGLKALAQFVVIWLITYQTEVLVRS